MKWAGLGNFTIFSILYIFEERGWVVCGGYRAVKRNLHYVSVGWYPCCNLNVRFMVFYSSPHILVLSSQNTDCIMWEQLNKITYYFFLSRFLTNVFIRCKWYVAIICKQRCWLLVDVSLGYSSEIQHLGLENKNCITVMLVTGRKEFLAKSLPWKEHPLAICINNVSLKLWTQHLYIATLHMFNSAVFSKSCDMLYFLHTCLVEYEVVHIYPYVVFRQQLPLISS